jgi:hypothetical protein
MTTDGGRAVEHGRLEQVNSPEYRRQQPPRIDVTTEHRGRPIGRVVHLERDADEPIWAIALVDAHDELHAGSFASEAGTAPTCLGLVADHTAWYGPEIRDTSEGGR